jgi:signal transduction histidine kinase
MIDFIKDYLRYRKALLVFYLCVIIFFPLVHFLSGSPMTSMGYSILIISFILILWILIDAPAFYRRIRRLKNIRDNISSFIQDFPAGRNAVEDSYQGIIGGLCSLVSTEREETLRRHAEQNDYYTMWIHQIKTPISAMRLALQSGEHDPVIDQELFKIEQYAEMALQYVKLDHLESDLVIREYRLQDIVRDSIKKYASLFIYRKLALELAEFDIPVVTDSKWLSFIIEQILSNSIKYTRQGGIRITAVNKELAIEDTGIGIRAEDIERIFEKGYTGYNGRLDKKASGIGLYMAKKAADQLAVGIRITSEVGKGTRAVLKFPDRIEMTAM